MKIIIQKLGLLVAMLLTTFSASAGINTVEIDGIYYDLNSSSLTATVTNPFTSTFGNPVYSGSVTIPETVVHGKTTYRVTSINREAFCNCDELTSVTIPNSVTSIGINAFYGCTGLTSVTIPNSVTSIGVGAFQMCNRLTSVTIPNSVTTIGVGAFMCTSLTEITVESGNSVYDSRDNCNAIIETASNILVAGCKNTIIPNSVTSIGYYAFSCCIDLTSVTIPNSVTSIGDYAFYNCLGLTSIIFEDGDATLSSGCNGYNSDGEGKGLFYDCPLTSLYLGRNLSYNADKSSGYSPFYNKVALKLLTIGNSVTAIGDCAFKACTGLTSVIIPNSVTAIGNSAFNSCSGLTSVIISNSVTTIGDYAFNSCSGLTSVIIPNSVTTIGDYAFNSCSGLTSVIIPNSVTTIGKYAFYNTSLASLTICSTVNTIGKDAFYPKPVKTIWLTNTPPTGYTYANGRINYVANDQYSSLSNKMIYPYLSSIFEVNGVKYVPVSPSERTCDAIDCAYDVTAENIDLNAILYKGVNMVVENINQYAFYGNTYMKNITISKNITSVGNYVFSGCSALVEVEISDRETELTLGCNGSNPMFADCPLKTVYIGGNISYPTSSSYGYSPFYRNTTLESVTITDKETEITENEFYGCTSLKSISIGYGVETIDNWAFSGCSSLDSFEFGAGMKTIGKEAFSDCTAMTKLVSHATVPPTCGSQALDDINKWNCELFVPAASIAKYQAADQWKEFFFISDAGVDGVNIDSDEAVEVMRYDIRGRLLSEPEQGINIVKMSDGSVRKAQVK